MRGFLTEAAAELATLQRELVIVYQENDRLKGALERPPVGHRMRGLRGRVSHR